MLRTNGLCVRAWAMADSNKTCTISFHFVDRFEICNMKTVATNTFELRAKIKIKWHRDLIIIVYSDVKGSHVK